MTRSIAYRMPMSRRIVLECAWSSQLLTVTQITHILSHLKDIERETYLEKAVKELSVTTAFVFLGAHALQKVPLEGVHLDWGVSLGTRRVFIPRLEIEVWVLFFLSLCDSDCQQAIQGVLESTNNLGERCVVEIEHLGGAALGCPDAIEVQPFVQFIARVFCEV